MAAGVRWTSSLIREAGTFPGDASGGVSVSGEREQRRSMGGLGRWGDGGGWTGLHAACIRVLLCS